MSSATQEHDTQLRADQEAFNKELVPLLGKYHLLLASQCFITQDGTIASRIVVVRAPDGTPSPISKDIITE